MKICAASDIHGFLPQIPDCDLLLLAGDYVHGRKGDWQTQLRWINKSFAPWLETLSQRMKIIGVAGNHDYVFERHKGFLPELAWTYLEDSSVTFDDLKIYGSPQNVRFFDWSFNKTEQQLVDYWDMIPVDTNILLLHQPLRGVADWTPYGNTNAGSYTLTNRVGELAQHKNLKLIVTGHLHSNAGLHNFEGIPVVSACYCDEDYHPKYNPFVVEV